MIMKILVLGHNGMLGNVVYKYFKQQGHEIETIGDLRWDDSEFKKTIFNSEAEYIINCVGAIHQKNYDDDYYHFLNVRLPMFLEYTGKKVLHPSTDCVFHGTIQPPQRYEKDAERDADDPYGASKAKIDKMIVDRFKNTKIIRTSIVGHEIKGFHSLLDWFLGTPDNQALNGYSNYFWNGITTLQWCKVAEEILLKWKKAPVLTQVGSEGMHKCLLLKTMGKVYGKSNQINEFEMETPLNKMLLSDYELPTIEQQLIELKEFYGK